MIYVKKPFGLHLQAARYFCLDYAYIHIRSTIAMVELVRVIASAVTFETIVAQLTTSITCLKGFCE